MEAPSTFDGSIRIWPTRSVSLPGFTFQTGRKYGTVITFGPRVPEGAYGRFQVIIRFDYPR